MLFRSPGLTPRVLGEVTGVESVALSVANLPAHTHTLPWGGVTDSAGANQSFTSMQPSLTLNYAVPLQGIYPSRESSFEEPWLGHLSLTARSLLPNGWTTANGQLLPINQNQAVFSILGTTYGGDGRTTFALPDLRGRAVAGAEQTFWGSTWSLGEQPGTEQTALTFNQLPNHAHILSPLSDFTGATGMEQPLDSVQPSQIGRAHV